MYGFSEWLLWHSRFKTCLVNSPRSINVWLTESTFTMAEALRWVPSPWKFPLNCVGQLKGSWVRDIPNYLRINQRRYPQPEEQWLQGPGTWRQKGEVPPSWTRCHWCRVWMMHTAWPDHGPTGRSESIENERIKISVSSGCHKFRSRKINKEHVYDGSCSIKHFPFWLQLRHCPHLSPFHLSMF